MNLIKNNYLMLALAAIICSADLSAQTASGFGDIVNSSARYLDTEMADKGYNHIKTEKYGSNSYTYWWNYRDNKCVCVNTTNGEIKSVVNTLPADCNKSDTNANHHDYSYNRHSSHHHDDYNHYSERDVDNAFERGYNDGLHHTTYHNIYSNSAEKTAYSKGYGTGTGQRINNTSYHSGRGGYHPHSGVDDLIGHDANSAYVKLEDRGFSEVKEHQNDGKTYRVWFNRNTDQCIKTISVNKRISEVLRSTSCN